AAVLDDDERRQQHQSRREGPQHGRGGPGTGWAPGELSWRLAVLGLGVGISSGPVFTLVITAAPAASQGTAGAAQSLARQLGFAVGPALATVAWSLSGHRVAGMRAGFAVAALLAVLTVGAVLWGRPGRAGDGAGDGTGGAADGAADGGGQRRVAMRSAKARSAGAGSPRRQTRPRTESGRPSTGT
ncbi:hypothetical protein AB0J52_39070, partial [Spirillospora sp. NPDC049652]